MYALPMLARKEPMRRIMIHLRSWAVHTKKRVNTPLRRSVAGERRTRKHLRQEKPAEGPTGQGGDGVVLERDSVTFSPFFQCFPICRMPQMGL